MQTAKKLGFKKGDFVHTGSFPGIIIGDVRTATPTCEVWGFEHEMGSAYAHDLKRLSWTEFQALAARYGFDGTAYSKAAKDAIRLAMSCQTGEEGAAHAPEARMTEFVQG